MPRVRLEPLGVELEAPAGTALRDLLFPYGVEFPCGGRARCGRCRVRVDGEDVLACHQHVEHDTSIEVRGWRNAILSDHAMASVSSATGLGVAVDLGTTSIVAQLVDGATGTVLATRAELNQQARFGADVMTRIEHALTLTGAAELRDLLRNQVARMVGEVQAGRSLDRGVVVVGNTVMQYLFRGCDVTPLSAAPFEPGDLADWRDGDLRFIRPVGGFVGSDILAGVMATGMADAAGLNVLLDLGTNGEIVVGNRDRLLCASTAAGPAFEGGRISCGMRAGSGAISAVDLDGTAFTCSVMGGGVARGICGSGLVDAIAAALDSGALGANGRFQTPSRRLELRDGLALTQADVRELQLAKGAVAAGLAVLLDRLGATPADVNRVYLAGAFGNYVRVGSAARIGLVPFDDDRVEPVGNSALAGAKLALFGAAREDVPMEHVPLHADACFQERYVEAMAFPR